MDNVRRRNAEKDSIRHTTPAPVGIRRASGDRTPAKEVRRLRKEQFAPEKERGIPIYEVVVRGGEVDWSTKKQVSALDSNLRERLRKDSF